MEKKTSQDVELLQDLVDRASALEGVEVVAGDGFVMMSPVSLEHVRTFRHVTNVLEQQLSAEDGVEAVGGIEFGHAEWDTEKSPDVVLWRPVEDAQRDAGLIELACEIVSPSSVEDDYVAKASAYATAKIPAYLVLDPCTRSAVLFTRPTGTSYRSREEFEYGEVVALSLSLGKLTLDTGSLPVAPEATQRTAWPAHRTFP